MPVLIPPRYRPPLRAARDNAWRSVFGRQHALGRAWREHRDLDHLVPEPVFVLCPVRSGSTLLRSLLDTHTQICAPHELHLNTMQVSTRFEYAERAWDAVGLSTDDLANMLWDRALHRMLVVSGKRIVVDKTPQNVTVWQRIHEYWPRARYLHLRRHPAAIAASLDHARPDRSSAGHVQRVVEYGQYLDEARAALPGPTLRYEDLTTAPVGTLTEVCEYLGVRFQKRMLTYRRTNNRAGLGDWSPKIRSGRIQPHEPLPPLAEVPADLKELARAWGY